ncbi:MAG: hypothetical protein H7070_14355 [Saprospiraceae bacterium]|nr:hypothetical protein [Pyrinomonadaceae bacterium]
MTKLVRSNIDKNLSQDCKDFIKRLIEKAHDNSPGSVIKSTGVLELFDAIAASTGSPDPHGNYGGVWGYLEHSQGSTAYSDWGNNIASIGLAMSNYATGGSQGAGFAKLGAGGQLIGTLSSFNQFWSTTHGAFTTIHEVLHTSVSNGAADDIGLARAALNLTGQELNLRGLSNDAAIKKAGSIWTNRLTQARGNGSLRSKRFEPIHCANRRKLR